LPEVFLGMVWEEKKIDRPFISPDHVVILFKEKKSLIKI
jgi:hypothetical protein